MFQNHQEAGGHYQPSITVITTRGVKPELLTQNLSHIGPHGAKEKGRSRCSISVNTVGGQQCPHLEAEEASLRLGTNRLCNSFLFLR